MNQHLKVLILGGVGGLLYVVLELIWRGYSHWTMFFLGGLCFVLVGAINEWLPWDMPIWQQGLIGAGTITGLEFLMGCVVNLWLGWGIWDYNNVPGNVLGQICVPYAILWIPVSLIAIMLDDWLRYWFFGEERPRYNLCFRKRRRK